MAANKRIIQENHRLISELSKFKRTIKDLKMKIYDAKNKIGIINKNSKKKTGTSFLSHPSCW